MSKRLWTQIDNMDRCYKTNIVIIYGSITDAINNLKENTRSKIPEPARSIMLSNKFLGGIGKIILDTDVKPVWVKNEEDAAKIITAVCKMKPIDREVIRPEVFRRIATDDLRIDVLIGIKGVSSKKAKALLKKFGSISEIAHHSAIEISKIEGIGSTVANRILTVLESERRVRI